MIKNLHLIIWAMVILGVGVLLGFAAGTGHAHFNGAYDASYSTGYREGRHGGEIQGRKKGEDLGRRRAEYDAKTGYAWQIYLPAALPSFANGAVGGLILQYTILLNGKHSGRLSLF